MKKILTYFCFFLLVLGQAYSAPKNKNANKDLDFFEDDSAYIDNLRAEVEAEFEYQKKEMEKELARQKAALDAEFKQKKSLICIHIHMNMQNFLFRLIIL